jgi:hypothetical protein
VRDRIPGSILALLLFIVPIYTFSQESAVLTEETSAMDSIVAIPDTLADIGSPVGVVAKDTENDAGENITVQWQPPEDPEGILIGFEVFRSDDKEQGFALAGFVGRETLGFKDKVKDGVEYFYKVRAKTKRDRYSPFSSVSSGAVSRPQIFHTGRLNVLIAVVIFVSLVLFFVSTARKGKQLFIRRIAGLDALDEAVGRATEMGKPILYVPGLSTMSDVATIAAINILGPVAKKAAEYESNLLVPNRDPIVMTVARQVVKEAFLEAGKPDTFSEDMVFFLTDSQFGYAAAVDGIMVREKPATNLFLGMFWAESLILAETGNMTGAIQIAGTDAVAQLPFFVTACDYTIIGEELYAASAYLSRAPLLVGSLKAQDFGKAILIITIVVMFFLAIVNTGISFANHTGNEFISRIITFFQGIFNV